MRPPAPHRPKHVLHLGPDVPGGMRTAMRSLLASPLAERYKLDVVPTHRGAGAARRLAVYSLAVWRLAWWSIRRRGRIVHIHSTVRGSMYRKAVLVLVAKALGRRVVLHIHSGPGDLLTFRAGMSESSAALLRFSLRWADVVLAVSAASAVQLENAFAITGVDVIPNAAPPVSAVAAVVACPDPVAVFLGGFANSVKGGNVMLDALERLQPGSLQVVLAGPGELPARGHELTESMAEVSWRGWLEGEERDGLMSSASIFVLASTSEGLPLALLEAMSSGLAIVSTDVGGVPDVVENEVEALIIPPGDPLALAAALERVAGDAELRVSLGTAARERASHMSVEPVAERLDALYRHLLEN